MDQLTPIQRKVLNLFYDVKDLPFKVNYDLAIALRKYLKETKVIKKKYEKA